MNKKGFIYAFMLGIVGLLIVLVWLYVAGAKVAATEQLAMGQSSFEALQGLHDREVAMQYFDVGSQHASYDAVMDLVRVGGWKDAPCGSFGATSLWYDRGAVCLPSERNLSDDLAGFLENNHFTRQLAKNPYIKGEQNPRDYVYYAGIGKSTVLEGHASKPVLLTVRCITQRKEAPAYFGGTQFGHLTEFLFDWNPFRAGSTTFACGQIAMRHVFKHQLNVSTQAILDAGMTVSALMPKIQACDGDVSPITCLQGLELPSGWVSQVSADNDGNAVGIYTVRIGDVLPGFVDPPALRFAIRVKKGAVAS